MLRPYYITCAACAWFRQRIREIISTKSSKNRHSRKFRPLKILRYTVMHYVCIHNSCTIRYCHGGPHGKSIWVTCSHVLIISCTHMTHEIQWMLPKKTSKHLELQNGLKSFSFGQISLSVNQHYWKRFAMLQSVPEGLPWLHSYGKYARDVAKKKEETELTKEEVPQ